MASSQRRLGTELAERLWKMLMILAALVSHAALA
jgi:hypothetical protein